MLEDQQSEDRVNDGRKLDVSHRIMRFYGYNKANERLQIFRILAAKLHKDFEIRKALAWKACI
jgi:hypothetical protein